jgi:HK97 gp10 family phage protein
MAKDVEIEGLDVLARRLKALPDVVERACRNAVKAETTAVAQDMRRGAPRDTGELQESIQAEFDPKAIEGRAAATARHAKYVENGTTENPAQPFVEPAAERSRRRFPKRVREDVLAELRRIT